MKILIILSIISLNSRMNKIGNNLSMKLPNKTAPNLPAGLNTSFVNAQKSMNNMAQTVSNTATQAANSAMESVNQAAKSMSDVFSDFAAPINQSVQTSLNSEVTPFISIPLVISIGVLIILLILVIKFRDQIILGVESGWHATKRWFHHTFPSDQPAPTLLMPIKADHPHHPHKNDKVDHAAIQAMMPGKKEVFNIAANKYTYSDAEPLCKAFGAELATYDQVKQAWSNGADWCNYGWIKGQSAVYPTQQSTFDKLQAGPEDQHMSCGVPGVNGGYFDNPELRMGVNCYGTKPTENDTDDRYMAKKEAKTHDKLAYDQKVQDYKNQADHIPINPFKTGSWFA